MGEKKEGGGGGRGLSLGEKSSEMILTIKGQKGSQRQIGGKRIWGKKGRLIRGRNLSGELKNRSWSLLLDLKEGRGGKRGGIRKTALEEKKKELLRER